MFRCKISLRQYPLPKQTPPYPVQQRKASIPDTQRTNSIQHSRKYIKRFFFVSLFEWIKWNLEAVGINPKGKFIKKIQRWAKTGAVQHRWITGRGSCIYPKGVVSGDGGKKSSYWVSCAYPASRGGSPIRPSELSSPWFFSFLKFAALEVEKNSLFRIHHLWIQRLVFGGKKMWVISKTRHLVIIRF